MKKEKHLLGTGPHMETVWPAAMSVQGPHRHTVLLTLQSLAAARAREVKPALPAVTEICLQLLEQGERNRSERSVLAVLSGALGFYICAHKEPVFWRN